MTVKNSSKLQTHVTFCSPIFQSQRGRQAELGTVQFLVDNLGIGTVGDYRILINYSMSLHSTHTIEIDMVVINRFGVFLLEIKDWQGVVEAFDDYWMLNQKYKYEDAFKTINLKADALRLKIFGRRGELSELDKVNVVGIVVLVRGVSGFKNLSHNDEKAIVGLEAQLLQRLSSKNLLPYGSESRMLSNQEIQRITDTLYTELPKSRELFIGDYRVVGKLLSNNLFDAFEAVNVNLEHQHVRIKRYQLPAILHGSERAIEQLKRNAKAVSMLGFHPNILHTYHFFQDPDRSDVFYEVTELIDEHRLDKVMAQYSEPISFTIQLDYIESLCAALIHAHRHNVYHRNLNPETVFVSENGIVKLADFDFAKVVGTSTITNPGQVLVDSLFTAPEVLINPSVASSASDIYSLGVLWYFLASLPEKSPKLTLEKIDDLRLPRAVRELIKKMTTKVVRSRPQNVEDVLAQLKILRKKTVHSNNIG